MADLNALEARVMQIVRKEVNRRLSDLESVGLRPQLHQPRRTEGKSGISSEIQIDFLSDGNLEDILEFHIYRNGAPTVDEADVSGWLADAVEDVVERRRQELLEASGHREG